MYILCKVPSVIETIKNFDTSKKFNTIKKLGSSITNDPRMKKVNDYLKILDNINAKRFVAESGSSVVLWTGPEGREEANKKFKDSKAFDAKNVGSSGLSYPFNRPSQYYKGSNPCLHHCIQLLMHRCLVYRYIATLVTSLEHVLEYRFEWRRS